MTQTAIQAKYASRRSRGVEGTPAWTAPVAELERPASQPGAAVDGQDLAGDVAGVVRHQERHRVGDLLGLCPSAPAAPCSVIRSTASGEFHSCFAAPGDSIGPGATALTRMPCGAHSTASVCVIDITPALAAAEWMVPALPVQT